MVRVGQGDFLWMNTPWTQEVGGWRNVAICFMISIPWSTEFTTFTLRPQTDLPMTSQQPHFVTRSWSKRGWSEDMQIDAHLLCGKPWDVWSYHVPWKEQHWSKEWEEMGGGEGMWPVSLELEHHRNPQNTEGQKHCLALEIWRDPVVRGAITLNATHIISNCP
jgi:hypothetical protein